MPWPALLLRVLSAPGQAFIETVFRVFEKPNNQDVVNLTLDYVAMYFSAARPEGPVDATLEELQSEASDVAGDGRRGASTGGLGANR